MKKTITLCILAIVATLHAWAAYPPSSYQLSADSKTLLNWNGPETTIDLTSDPVFNQLTTISGTAFRDKTAITSVKMVNSITTIGDYAFSNCTGLTSMTLSTGLTTLPTGILLGCKNLTSISIPNTVTAIGDNALSKTGLTAVTLPAGVTSLGAGALSGCTALTAISLPNTVNSLGANCFDGSGLTAIAIPAGVASIPNYCFANCTALNSVTMTNNVTSIGSYAFLKTGALTGITLSTGLTTLGQFVFRYSGLTSINLPNSITTMGDACFSSCAALTTANIPANPAFTRIPGNTFSNCSLLQVISIPNNIQAIGSYAFYNTKITTISFPSSVTTIEDYAFWACYSLTNVNIPASITSINGGCFSTCPSITAFTVDAANPNYSSDASGVLFNKTKTELVQFPCGNTATTYVFPSTVTKIADFACSGAVNLTSVTIPSSVTYIGKSAFYECRNLATAVIPNSVTTIGTEAFRHCYKLTSNNIPASVTKLQGGVFAECPLITTITVDPANTRYKTIGGALYNMAADTLFQYPCGNTAATYTIPSTVKYIDNFSFTRTVSLTSLTIPTSVTGLGSYCFALCTGLTNMVLPNSILPGKEGDFLFQDCSNLQTVTLPANSAQIGSRSFYGCTKLQSITIPASVTYIGYEAFYNCTSLTQVECANPIPPTLGNNDSFAGVNQSTCTLTVPIGKRLAYQTNPQQWRNFPLPVEKDFSGAAFWFQTTAAAGTLFSFTLGAKSGSGTARVNWGDGTSANNYALSASTTITGTLAGTPTGTPPVLSIRVYGSDINLLDLSGKPVTWLNTTDNPLTVSAIEKINITGTAITAVNVAANANLTDLACTGLGLTALNLSANAKLVNLDCSNNSLTALNLSANTLLQGVNCSRNALASLTLPASNTALKGLDCSYNQLTTLTLPTNTAALTTGLNVAYNKLNLGTLPAKPANLPAALYAYSAQPRLQLPKNNYEGAGDVVDLSAQLPATSTYVWKTQSGAALTAGVDYSITGGKTSFLRGQPEPVYCEISNPAFSALKSYTGAASAPVVDAAFRTSSITFGITRTWLGTADSGWANAANWDGGLLPTAGDDVVVSPTATNDLILDADRTVNNIANNTTNRAIIIPAGRTLTVQGSVSVNAPERILIKSEANNPNGSLIFTKPSLNTAVRASVEMYSKASTASTGQYPHKWQYFGSPIQGASTGATFGVAQVRKWMENATNQQYMWVNADATLQPMRGYEVNQNSPQTYTFKGELNVASQTKTLTTTAGALYPGNHILANPFASGARISQFEMDNGLDKTVYVYNTGSRDDWNTNNGATTPGYNPGQYISVPLGQAGYMGLPDTIPSMQGFLVRTLGGSGVMTIPYSATAKNIRPQYAPEQDRICLIIDVKSENSADRVWLFNRQGTTSNFDNGWDGRKMIMNGATQIYAAEQGGNFQVSTNEELNGTYIAFQPGIDTEYTMTFNPASIESKYQNLYLLDTKNGVVTEINKESSYRFTSEKTDNAKRFKIVTSHTTTAVDLKKADTEIVVFSFDNIVYVNNNTNENATMIIYDISGVEIQRSTINAKSDISITTSIPKGIYVVNIKTTSHNVRKQIAIR